MNRIPRLLAAAALAIASLVATPARAQLAPIHIGTVVSALAAAAAGGISFAEAVDTLDCAITGAGPVCASPMDEILGDYEGTVSVTAWNCGSVPLPLPFPFGLSFRRAPGRLVEIGFEESILDIDPVFLEPDTAYDPGTGMIDVGPLAGRAVILICPYIGEVTIAFTFDAGAGSFVADAAVSARFPIAIAYCLGYPRSCDFDAELFGERAGG